MDDVDQEELLAQKKREERRVRRALDRQAPQLHTVEEFQLHVLDDPEFLVCIHIGSDELCPHWRRMQPELEKLTKARKATVHAKHYRVDVQKCAPEVLQALRVSELPSSVFYLKGQQTAEMRGTSNAEKIMGAFRNALIRRNEEMFEYDEAKKPKPPAEEGEGEEGEEGEEGQDDAGDDQ